MKIYMYPISLVDKTVYLYHWSLIFLHVSTLEWHTSLPLGNYR